MRPSLTAALLSLTATPVLAEVTAPVAVPPCVDAQCPQGERCVAETPGGQGRCMPMAAPESAPPVAAPVAAPVLAPPVAPASAAAPASTESQVEVGVHAYGLAIGSFLTELDASKKVIMHNGTPLRTVYPGFAGFSGGGGIAADVSYRGIIGLQLGLFGSVDEGEGSINDVDFVIGQTAIHLPILVKVSAPVPTVRPFAVIGPEFVFPGETSASPATAGGVDVAAEAESYIALAFGFGFEFVLPVPDMDVRIPFTLRGSWNPSVEDDITSRARFDIEGSQTLNAVVFKSEWEWQAVASMGVAFYFHP
jgi:hypothetical protein